MIRPALLGLPCLIAPRAVGATPTILTGKVCSVRNGDTLTAFDGTNRKHRIRSTSGFASTASSSR